jgi:hypothetical protein
VDVPERRATLGGNGPRVRLVGGGDRVRLDALVAQRPPGVGDSGRVGRPVTDVDAGRARALLALGRLGGVDVPADPDGALDGAGEVLGEVELDDRPGPVELERVLGGGRRTEPTQPSSLARRVSASQSLTRSLAQKGWVTPSAASVSRE